MSLAESGARVVVLEKGKYYSIRDFTHDEIAICRRNFFVPYLGDDPHTIRKNGAIDSKPTREGWTSQCVGGATVHMSGFTYRLKEQDLRLKTLTGGIAGADIADWPITLEELVPFYDLAEAAIGVSGIAGINPFDAPRRPFPLPPMRPHPTALLVDEAARSLGFHPFPTPRAIVSSAYGTRPPCNYCGLCGDYGCENGSKSSTLASLLPRAEATGRCEIRSECMVSRVLVDDTDTAIGVEYIDRRGELQAVYARTVVIAASAIESARLLLMSADSQHRDGIANSSGLVGKNLTFSSFGKGTGIFDRQAIVAKLGPKNMSLPFLLRSVQDDYWIPDAGLGMPKGGTYNFLLHHPNPINAAVRLATDSDWAVFGQPLKDRMQSYFHEEVWVEFEVFGEFLPWKGCYVDLDPVTKDRWNLPVARINLQNHPVEIEVNKWLTARGLDILNAIKPTAKEVKPWTWGGTTFHLQHGTCRFGKDPAHSVLDPSCQAHDVKNLYVTDGSFMPTSGAVPATPTILANSFRVARHIRDKLA